ncbi:YkvA family protein [Sphaerisporangium corydalis]|uniref:YkvA family protein n=1 Tax=Sphaerisporangium corydalis TaxID=1441875 RepID=A0ABV9EHN3_9ACTN|nr:YkvA family protein [Sphaerisporangium corydalis]
MGKTGRATAAYRAYKDVSRPGSPGLMARIKAFPRMIGGSMRGEYRDLGKGKLAMMGLGVLYIVSPFDIVPDFLPLIGVTDDFGVFLWLMSSLLGESGRYLDWEHKKVRGEVV